MGLKVVHSSLTSEVKSRILDMILFNANYKPGDRLNESELASLLGVSKAPIREAFRELYRQGLLEVVPRRGVFVVQFSQAEFDEITGLRFQMEESIYKDIFKNDLLKDEDFKALLDSAYSMLAISRRQQPQAERVRDFLKEDVVFHSLIWKRSTLKWTRKILLDIHCQILLATRERLLLSSKLEENAEIHFAVVKALKEKDLDILLRNRWVSYFSPSELGDYLKQEHKAEEDVL